MESLADARVPRDDADLPSVYVVKANTSRIFAQISQPCRLRRLHNSATVIQEGASMRIGLQIPFFSWPDGPEQLGTQFGAVAERAEARASTPCG